MKRFLGAWLMLGALPLVLVAQMDPDQEFRAARKNAAAAAKVQGEERVAVLTEARAQLMAAASRAGEGSVLACKAQLEAGRISEKLKDWKTAEAAFRSASTATETAVMADALAELAALALRQERRDEAEQWLVQIVERCAEEEQDRARAMVRLGEIARSRSRAADAAQWFRRVLAEHGELWRPAADALEELVELQLASSERASAKQTFDSHAMALRARFAGSPHEKRLQTALGRIAARAKFDVPSNG